MEQKGSLNKNYVHRLTISALSVYICTSKIVCDCAEARKQEAYTAEADARPCITPNTRKLKKNFNRVARLGKKELRRARFDHIRKVGAKLFGHSQKRSKRTSVDPQCRPFRRQRPVRISQKEVRLTLPNLDVNKASGPDGIPAIVLRNCAPEMSSVLTRLFRFTLETGVGPKSWKLANVQPAPKKGSRVDLANYRPISVTSILCKIMERVLNNGLEVYLEDYYQYGFRQGRSTVDLLVYATHTWGEAI